MELDHEFIVPVPVDEAWSILSDPDQVAPFVPGVTLDPADDDGVSGRLKLRLRSTSVTYRGTARLTSQDEGDRVLTVKASGDAPRGGGTARATIRARLHAEDDRTRVAVHTRLIVTGRAAEFDRAVMSDSVGRIIARFADELSTDLADADVIPSPSPAPPPEPPEESAENEEPEPEETEAAKPESQEPEPEKAKATKPKPREPEPEEAEEPEESGGPDVDGAAVARRLAPVMVGAAALWTLQRLARRVRRRRAPETAQESQDEPEEQPTEPDEPDTEEVWGPDRDSSGAA